MKALLSCDSGVETAYGADQFSAKLKPAYSDFFEREAFMLAVPTGTAGNGLALGAMTPPRGSSKQHRCGSTDRR